eukprot:TRINITY_DN8597_c0_g4_i2.p1 TRINITY_DN8597_c0_g4~~TRINITY_DN8597_c0_g4_i2.p1  ORF type:complete len:249 (+),score=55.50 TRINITY_DN8597_c0_g4_i2:95-841(+)
MNKSLSFIFMVLSLISCQLNVCPVSVTLDKNDDVKIEIATERSFECLWEIRNEDELSFEMHVEREDTENTELTIFAGKLKYGDSAFRNKEYFTEKMTDKLLTVTYTSTGSASKLLMEIYVESDPMISKIYIYIIGIVLGSILIIGIIITLYIFRSWFDCIYSWPCCNSIFVKAKLPAILKKYPEEKYEPDKNKFSQENCPICLCDFKEGTIRVLQCKHIFHGNCIVAWFTKKSNDVCPICNGKPCERV